MDIHRCSQQGSARLEEYYDNLNEPERTAMLNLLDFLRPIEDMHKVWGFTSHDYLILVPEDDFQSQSCISILALDHESYSIEYRNPGSSEVSVEARSPAEAVELVRSIMKGSGGWSVDND